MPLASVAEKDKGEEEKEKIYGKMENNKVKINNSTKYFIKKKITNVNHTKNKN